jgi:hypothetical protein
LLRDDRSSPAPTGIGVPSAPGDPSETHEPRVIRRRALLKAGAGAGLVSAAIPLAGLAPARARFSRFALSGPTSGDIAILRFLAAAEILETDLWEQYNELGGIQDSEVPGGSGITAYTQALQNLDGDMPQYIHDNTDDEHSHFSFINAYLQAHGAEPVNLDHFRKLKGSTATGVNPAKIGKRLTNLLELTVDTSWWLRYRSDTGNPDLGDSFAQAVPDLANGKFPAIPRDNGDVNPLIQNHIQAIANTAAFHFGFIEQGGSSLYPSLAQRVTNVEVLRILLSIGPTETSHFQTWHDKAGNGVSDPIAPFTDPTNGLSFPNLNASGGESTQTNLIMPEPTIFLKRSGFPKVSIIRPTDTVNAAHGAVKALTDDGLFIGQSDEFFEKLQELAAAADAAVREF